MNKETGTWGKVRKAFAILRKQGVETHMDYMCCSACALAEMDDKRPRKVYFHQQDSEAYMEEGGTLAIRYCIFEDIKDSDSAPFEARVMAHAKNIQKVLKGVGCRVKWSGKTDEVLEVVG